MLTFNRRRFVYGSGSVLAAPRLARAESGAVPIGACLPLTGPLAAHYEQAHQALKLAQDEINGAGGVNGRPLRIVLEDAQSSGAAALRAFQKLDAEIAPAAMFLPGAAAQVLAISSAASEKQIPSLHSSAASAPRLSGNAQLFALRPAESIETETLCGFVARKLAARRAAIIAVNDETSRAAARQARSLLEAAGLEIAAEEFYGARDDDVSGPLQLAAASPADCLAAFPHSRDAALIITARRALNIAKPLAISGAAAEPAALALVNAQDLGGVYTVTGALPGGAPGSAAAGYQKRFRYRYQRAAEALGAFYYDGAMMLAFVMRKHGAERGAVRAGLASMSGFEGAAQTYRADAEGSLAHQAFAVSFRPGTKELQLAEAAAG